MSFYICHWATSDLHYRQRITTDVKNSVKDSEFFKTLYCMANVGPICLLNKLSLSPANRGQMSLADILQEGWHPVVDGDSIEKRTVETDLFMLAMEAACYGHEILEVRLTTLCEKWRSLLDLNPTSSSSTMAGQVTFDSEVRNKELQMKLAMNEWIEGMRYTTHRPSCQSYIAHVERAISQIPPSRSASPTGSPAGGMSHNGAASRNARNMIAQGTVLYS